MASKEFLKKQKREERVKRKLKNRRLQHSKLAKEKLKEARVEVQEVKAEAKKDAVKRVLMGSRGAPTINSFIPGPNKPCLCGSGKKFKRCCSRDIASGKIQLVAQEDNTLDPNAPEVVAPTEVVVPAEVVIPKEQKVEEKEVKEQILEQSSSL